MKVFKTLPTLSLLVVMLILVTACNESGTEYAEASERTIKIVKQAVEIADEFIDNEITATTAQYRINSLDYIEYMYDNFEDTDFFLDALVTSLGLKLFSFERNATLENFDNIVRGRNYLAEEAGAPTRFVEVEVAEAAIAKISDAEAALAEVIEINRRIAMQAIEITDAFLNEAISALTAREQIDTLASIESVDRESSIMYMSIEHISLFLLIFSVNDTAENLDVIVHSRNILAERLDIPLK